MPIREMRREECLRVLAGARLARLGCARENQPYVVPVYLAYHEPPGGEPCLYGFTTPGQKVEWMRANPLVCVEVDEVTPYDQWVSVIVFGRYEELAEAPECDDERLRAWEVLKKHAVWWEPGATAWAVHAHRNQPEPFVPLYYRVWIDRVTGHQATQDEREAMSYAGTAAPAGRPGWLRRVLTCVFGGRFRNTDSASRGARR
jgi:uncharacterized protein